MHGIYSKSLFFIFWNDFYGSKFQHWAMVVVHDSWTWMPGPPVCCLGFRTDMFVSGPLVRKWKISWSEIEGKFGTYRAFIWLFRASLFAWTNLLSTYSLIIHHLCVQKITKIQNYIKKYLMRTKSLFDYDHEGTKNNKNDMFNFTQGYMNKYSSISNLGTFVQLFFGWFLKFGIYLSALGIYNTAQ